MFPSAPLGALLLGALPLLVAPAAAAGPLSSPKRGLVFTPNATTPLDNYVWTRQPSSLTWYYNYKPDPSGVYGNLSQEEFEFVPMLWGTPDDINDTSFLTSIKRLVKEKGVNITNVLTFNEPDGPFEWGGSNMDPGVAAQVWVNNIEPLREMGIRVGLPACTGAPTGLEWLKKFLNACSVVLSGDGPKRNCTYDFTTIHWYGPFDGLASHMGNYAANFPNKTVWITEYNLDNQELEYTQSFYNMSAEYFDRMDYVERYSLFAAFRSGVSNVGPNAAMLNNAGELTDIGNWYLGRPSTGVQPKSGAAFHSAAPQYLDVLVGALLAGAALLGF